MKRGRYEGDGEGKVDPMFFAALESSEKQGTARAGEAARKEVASLTIFSSPYGLG